MLLNQRRYTLGCLAASILLGLALVQSSSQQDSAYNPWLDYNDDGIIDVYDLEALGQVYGTSGTPLNTPMALKYDSGWLDITSMQGKYIFINHNLNLGTQNFVASIWGKTTVDGAAHQRQLDTTGYTPGWNRKYADLIESRSVIKTADGGYALAGMTGSLFTNYDIRLVKTDAAGFVQWSQTYGGSKHEIPYSLVQTNDGGYAIAGEIGRYSTSSGFLLVKVDSLGNHQWNNTYAPAPSDAGPFYTAYSLVQLADGGYAMAGYGYTVGSLIDNSDNVYLVKTDSSGSMEWEQTFGLADRLEHAYSLVQTSDGGYAIAGSVSSPGPIVPDSWLVKTDSSGNIQWNQTYGGAGTDETFALVQTSDDGYALAGGSNSYFVGGSFDFWLVKTDAAGIAQWDRVYAGADDSEAYSMIQTSDGGYAMAGYTVQHDSGIFDFSLVKTNSSGNKMWDKSYGVSDLDSESYSLVQTSDDGYALAGYSGDDAWLVKTDAFGQMSFSEVGLSVAGYSENSITLFRGKFDSLWNYIRVRIWIAKESP
jgi:hypothetical protein